MILKLFLMLHDKNHNISSLARHFLLKCLCHVRKVSGHVYVCQGYRCWLCLCDLFVLDFDIVPIMWYLLVFNCFLSANKNCLCSSDVSICLHCLILIVNTINTDKLSSIGDIWGWFEFMVFNATFNNNSAMSFRSLHGNCPLCH